MSIHYHNVLMEYSVVEDQLRIISLYSLHMTNSMVAGRNRNIPPFTLDSKQLFITSPNDCMTPAARFYESIASCPALEAHKT